MTFKKYDQFIEVQPIDAGLKVGDTDSDAIVVNRADLNANTLRDATLSADSETLTITKGDGTTIDFQGGGGSGSGGYLGKIGYGLDTDGGILKVDTNTIADSDWVNTNFGRQMGVFHSSFFDRTDIRLENPSGQSLGTVRLYDTDGISITTNDDTNDIFFAADTDFLATRAYVDENTGGASVTYAVTPPTDPANGDLWFNCDSDDLNTYVYDSDQDIWIDTSPAAGGGSGGGGGFEDSDYFKVNSTGTPANATGADSIAIGVGVTSSGTESIVIGNVKNSKSPVAGNNSIVIGSGAQADTNDAIAIGEEANASFGSSIALGDGATTTKANQMWIGDVTEIRVDSDYGSTDFNSLATHKQVHNTSHGFQSYFPDSDFVRRDSTNALLPTDANSFASDGADLRWHSSNQNAFSTDVGVGETIRVEYRDGTDPFFNPLVGYYDVTDSEYNLLDDLYSLELSHISGQNPLSSQANQTDTTGEYRIYIADQSLVDVPFNGSHSGYVAAPDSSARNNTHFLDGTGSFTEVNRYVDITGTGNAADAVGTDSVVIGAGGANAIGDNSIAIGYGSEAEAQYSLALGYAAQVTNSNHNNSIVIGQDADSSDSEQLSVVGVKRIRTPQFTGGSNQYIAVDANGNWTTETVSGGGGSVSASDFIAVGMNIEDSDSKVKMTATTIANGYGINTATNENLSYVTDLSVDTDIIATRNWAEERFPRDFDILLGSDNASLIFELDGSSQINTILTAGYALTHTAQVATGITLGVDTDLIADTEWVRDNFSGGSHRSVYVEADNNDRSDLVYIKHNTDDTVDVHTQDSEYAGTGSNVITSAEYDSAGQLTLTMAGQNQTIPFPTDGTDVYIVTDTYTALISGTADNTGNDPTEDRTFFEWDDATILSGSSTDFRTKSAGNHTLSSVHTGKLGFTLGDTDYINSAYSAGNGMNLSSGEFSVDNGNGLVFRGSDDELAVDDNLFATHTYVQSAIHQATFPTEFDADRTDADTLYTTVIEDDRLRILNEASITGNRTFFFNNRGSTVYQGVALRETDLLVHQTRPDADPSTPVANSSENWSAHSYNVYRSNGNSGTPLYASHAFRYDGHTTTNFFYSGANDLSVAIFRNGHNSGSRYQFTCRLQLWITDSLDKMRFKDPGTLVSNSNEFEIDLEAGDSSLDGVNMPAVDSESGFIIHPGQYVAMRWAVHIDHFDDTGISEGDSPYIVLANTTSSQTTNAGDCDPTTLSHSLFIGTDGEVFYKNYNKNPDEVYRLFDTDGQIPHLKVNAGFQAEAPGNEAIALGGSSQANDTDAIAIGFEATAGNEYSIAIGSGASTGSHNHSIALGRNASATHFHQLVIGGTANADRIDRITTPNFKPANVGDNSYVTIDTNGDWSLGAGGSGGFNADTDRVAIGNGSAATADGTVAIGTAVAESANSIAIGNNAGGVGTELIGTDAVAIGTGTLAEDSDAIAIGNSARANSSGSIAIGGDANASSEPSIAIGSNANASGFQTITIGHDATTTGNNSIVIGRQASTDQAQAVVIGRQANADGANATAIGSHTDADGTNSVALGVGCQATGDRGIAIGNDAIADQSASICIGEDANSTGIGQVCFGPNQLGLSLPVDDTAASDPSNMPDGTIYYNSNTNRFRAKLNGSWGTLDFTADP